MEKQHLLALSSALLSAATAAGATSARCVVSKNHTHNLKVREGRIDTFAPRIIYNAKLTVFDGQRRATVRTVSDDPQYFDEVAKEAMSLAQFSSAHECDGIASRELWPCDPSDIPEQFKKLDLVESATPPDFSVLKTRVFALHDLAMQVEGVVRATAGVGYRSTEEVVATSNGFIGYESGTNWQIWVEVVGNDNGETIAGDCSSYVVSRQQLRSNEELVMMAKQNMELQRGSVRPQTQRIPVIIDYQVAGTVISAVINALDADACFNKKTFLAGSVGTKCFSDMLTITERPHIVNSPFASLYDCEGVVRRERVLIDHGTPLGWIGNYEECLKIGIAPTGHASGVSELFISPGPRSVEAISNDLPAVLIVTGFNGHGFDEETGDVSVGIEGYILTAGKRQPVHEAVIAGDFRNMLACCEPASDVDPDGPFHVPSLFLGEVQLSGI